MRTSKRLTMLALATSVVFSVLPAAPASATTSWRKCFNYKVAERQFAAKINLARTAGGVGELRLDKQLSAVARKHTREMVRNNSLYHTSSSALSRRVTRWTILGENVGVGGTVGSLHSAFMDSPAHRDNALYGKFRHVGIGTKEANGRLWVTIVFEAATNPGTTLRTPSC